MPKTKKKKLPGIQPKPYWEHKWDCGHTGIMSVHLTRAGKTQCVACAKKYKGTTK